MKILLLFGGPSNEHDVSIDTAKQVFQKIDKKKYNVSLLYVDKFLRGAFLKSFHNLKNTGNNFKPFFTILDKLKRYNLIFLCLHGEFGEDGTIQSIFEAKNIKYTGSNSYASSLCMDKYRSALIAANIKGLVLPKTKLINKSADLWMGNKFPIVVKPNRSGSSVGVSIIRKRKDARVVPVPSDNEYIVQEYISGVEVSCGCLQSKLGTLVRLPPIEIHPKKSKFFDYSSKYSIGGSDELIPPVSIPKNIASRISEIACKIHQILGCSVYSRSDFIVRKDKIYYLETNTLPGMTSASLLPKEAKYIGMTYTKLLDFIIMNSLSTK